jgi:hypothetical protein
LAATSDDGELLGVDENGAKYVGWYFTPTTRRPAIGGCRQLERPVDRGRFPRTWDGHTPCSSSLRPTREPAMKRTDPKRRLRAVDPAQLERVAGGGTVFSEGTVLDMTLDAFYAWCGDKKGGEVEARRSGDASCRVGSRSTGWFIP